MKKKYKIPFLLTDHYGIYNELVDEPYSKRSPFFKFFTRKILRESSLFLPVSDDMGRAVSRLVLPKNYRVIFNTVNESYFHYRPRVRDNFRFIHVSNMAPLKNLPAILRAFAAISKLKPETELVIVGPHGPEELAAAVPTGLLNKSIFFKGEIPYHEVALEMQSADGLLLFSRTENMPCVVLEALCCGLPVIAPAVGGIPEVIDPSNGILVRPGYEEELKQAMLGMITESARFDGSSISKKAIARFGYPAIGEQISQIYEELISGRSD
jgi:glycosyltransferase involved in cell wall biosynthesis